MGGNDFKARWAARPPTIRALLVLYVGSLALVLVYSASLPQALFSVAMSALPLWGLWTGNRGVWLLALIGAALSLVGGIMGERRLPWYSLALSAVIVALLLASDTQDWVKRETRRRVDAAERRRAARRRARARYASDREP